MSCNSSSFIHVWPTHSWLVFTLSANTSFTVATPSFNNKPNFLKPVFTDKVNLFNTMFIKSGKIDSSASVRTTGEPSDQLLLTEICIVPVVFPAWAG